MNAPIKIAIFVTALASTMLFQNCGQFASDNEASLSSFAEASGGIVLLTSPRAGYAIEARAKTSYFPSGSQLLWDHEFGDGTSYCEQTTSSDRASTVFLCPTEGILKIMVIAVDASGNEMSDVLTTVVAADDGTIPTTPTPAESSGAQLYTSYCLGCHRGSESNGKITGSQKQNVTLARLNSAIGNASFTMDTSALRGLTPAERQKIVDALN